LARYPAGAERLWVQEEPRNQGAWGYLRGLLADQEATAGWGRALRCAGRAEGAAPATGSHRTHLLEQEAILREVLG
jgi:2-oxoglutarate dehydrogenase E1 component